MTIDEIATLVHGKVIGNNAIKKHVYHTLQLLPEELAKEIGTTTWFMGSFDDAYAYAFTGNDLKNQHLIFLSDDLFQQSREQIEFTIAHEIGHIILGHRNSVNFKQSKGEISRQEQEADAFAHQYGFAA